MDRTLEDLFDRQGGFATTAQLLARLSRRRLEAAVAAGDLSRVWHGVYCRGEIDDLRRLQALDFMCGTPVPVCLGTAAALYGFDTEEPGDLHVLSPPGSRLRSADGLVVHRREGAPVQTVAGRPATAAAWTAVEVARTLRRPRALATLDAALRSGTCTRAELWRAAVAQAGRRGIVAVRGLLPVADGRAESPMESEARLVMLDGGLPVPELQYRVVDGNGELRRLDFAWPERRVAAEYDGEFWHDDPAAIRRDRRRQVALQEVGWTVERIVLEDVRRFPVELVARLGAHLRPVAVA